jgi:hypothetical protein
LHELTTSFVLGYHGCDRAVAEALIAGDAFRYETNEWDWLGSGVYFWESNPLRGIEYAYELKANPRKAKSSVNNPAVVGAVIDLGLCLDLTSSMGIRALKTSYENFVTCCEAEGRAIPANKGGPDRLMRNLDCAVINHLHMIDSSGNFAPIRYHQRHLSGGRSDLSGRRLSRKNARSNLRQKSRMHQGCVPRAAALSQRLRSAAMRRGVAAAWIEANGTDPAARTAAVRSRRFSAIFIMRRRALP